MQGAREPWEPGELESIHRRDSDRSAWPEPVAGEEVATLADRRREEEEHLHTAAEAALRSFAWEEEHSWEAQPGEPPGEGIRAFQHRREEQGEVQTDQRGSTW